MKKTIKYLAATSLMLMSLACNRIEKYEHHSFATFGSDEYAVDEAVGTVKIPVSLFNYDGDVNVIVKAIDGKAVTGKDYSVVEPASGVLAFAKGETEKYVTIQIVPHVGEYTGDLDFRLELSSSSDALGLGSLNVAAVTIKDKDHPLSKLFGVFSGKAISYFDGTSFAAKVEIAADPKDPTKVLLLNLDSFMASNGLTASKGFNIFSGIVNEEQNSIRVVSGQLSGYADPEQGNLYLVGFDNPDPEQGEEDVDIVLNYNSDYTSITIPDAYSLRSGKGYWEIYLGGIVLNKK